MREDRARWNRRFGRTEEPVCPAGEPELASAIPLPGDHGLALDLACGRGANALFLAESGYDVVALDIAENGLSACQRAARQLDLNVYPVVMDLDCLVLPRTRFSLISVVRYLNRNLFPMLENSLAPGGFLFYKTFNRRFLVDNPDFNPDYVLQEGELLQAFAALDRVAFDESGTSSYLLARAKV